MRLEVVGCEPSRGTREPGIPHKVADRRVATCRSRSHSTRPSSTHRSAARPVQPARTEGSRYRDRGVVRPPEAASSPQASCRDRQYLLDTQTGQPKIQPVAPVLARAPAEHRFRRCISRDTSPAGHRRGLDSPLRLPTDNHTVLRVAAEVSHDCYAAHRAGQMSDPVDSDPHLRLWIQSPANTDTRPTTQLQTVSPPDRRSPRWSGKRRGRRGG